MKTLADHELSKFTTDAHNNSLTRVIFGGGQSISPLAKYVEATYSNENRTVTYTYYESSAKETLLNSITVTYNSAQDTSFVSAEWS